MHAWQVLHHWKQQGHKALFFTQTQQMLDIVERAVQAAEFRSDKFDGKTSDARSLDCIFQLHGLPQTSDTCPLVLTTVRLMTIAGLMSGLIPWS